MRRPYGTLESNILDVKEGGHSFSALEANSKGQLVNLLMTGGQILNKREDIFILLFSLCYLELKNSERGERVRG